MTAYLWNPATRKRGYIVTVLLDTSAGGGNYTSTKLIRSVERMVYRGKTIVSAKGRRSLRAANPADSGVAPMAIVGTATLPLVFPPEDRI